MYVYGKSQNAIIRYETDTNVLRKVTIMILKVTYLFISRTSIEQNNDTDNENRKQT